MAGIAREMLIAVMIEGRHSGEPIWIFDDPLDLWLIPGLGAFEDEESEGDCKLRGMSE